MNSVLRYAMIAGLAFMLTLGTATAVYGTVAPYPGWVNLLIGAELSVATVNSLVATGWRASKLVREWRERRDDERERRPSALLLENYRRDLNAVVNRPAYFRGPGDSAYLMHTPRYFDDIAFVPRYRIEERRRICYEDLEPGILVEGVRISSAHLKATEDKVRVLVCAAHGNEVPCPLCTPMDYYWRRP